MPYHSAMAAWTRRHLILLLLASVYTQAAEVKFELKPPFSGGYNPADPASPYFFFPSNASAGTFADDGVIKIGPDAVEVTAKSFTKTLPLSDIGTLDHPKYLGILKVPYGPPASSPAKKVVFEIKVCGRTYQTEANPFPSSLITDPNDDVRLASFGFVNLDFGTSIVLDFLLTNKGIYAVYERLAFSPALGPYKAFTQAKRVGNRVVNQWSSLKIVYNKQGGIVSWYVNNKVVFSVKKIGFISPDPDAVVIYENSGPEVVVSPAGFQSGFGYFTILDFTDPKNKSSDIGLVKLVSTPGAYSKPTKWFDPLANLGNRLWGQGAQIRVKSHTVSLSS
eukprot:TRINITY_DN5022_c0_g1_i1.p1 TRINITY_DN5022_c0_g1~~TRINITY_DN5022_c0_g1_i1.p1  ORF type:complete len:335 (-),score=45.31 TRINITY_DN5022_c0_g1_i1:549-1553(-)